jgi:hypothetical protein
VTFIACVVTMLVACANVVLNESLTAAQGLLDSRSVHQIISSFLKLFLLTAVSSLLFYLIVMGLAGRVDGSIAWQLAALLGLAWSIVGLSMAGRALISSPVGLGLFFSVLLTSLTLSEGFMVPPSQMSDGVLMVSRWTPTFCAQTVVDTSFLWQQKLEDDLIGRHHQEYRNLDPNRDYARGDVFTNTRPAIRALVVEFFWGIAGLSVAALTALSARRRTVRQAKDTRVQGGQK